MKPLCLCLFVLVSAAFACGQSSTQAAKVLTKVADVPMPGPAVRFDYQTFDASSGRLYIAHMNADQIVIFDTSKRQVVANLDGVELHAIAIGLPVQATFVDFDEELSLPVFVPAGPAGKGA